MLVAVALALAMNEACVASRANALAGSVAVQDFAGLSELWPQYESLAGQSWLGGAGVADLKRASSAQTLVLADRVMANYRTPMPTVRENQWKQSRDALRRAVTLTPGDASLRAALSYCEGHLHRINGEAAKARNERQAQEEFAEALVAFREAAALRPNWPDPFLGLARTFIYGLEDVDRGADALAQAEKRGHAPGDRETTQLADGYRARGEALLRTSQTLKDLPQERDYLTRAADAFREALTGTPTSLASAMRPRTSAIRRSAWSASKGGWRKSRGSREAGRGTDVYARGRRAAPARAASGDHARRAPAGRRRRLLSHWRLRSHILGRHASRDAGHSRLALRPST